MRCSSGVLHSAWSTVTVPYILVKKINKSHFGALSKGVAQSDACFKMSLVAVWRMDRKGTKVELRALSYQTRYG